VRRWVLCALLASGVAALAYWRRTLTGSGALAATVVGGVVLARGGVPAGGALLGFFASSSALSQVRERHTRHAPVAQPKGARRDAWQVLANGGIAAACLGLGGRRASSGFLGALAAAGADTWATELGMLAGHRPRLITTLQSVEPGISGGITAEGLAASIGGAGVVGLAWSLLGGDVRGARVALIAGTLGALVDSLLGATLQAVYRCEACGALAEAPTHPACQRPASLVRGRPWVTNDTVNAAATLAGAALATATEKVLDTERGGADQGRG
jgi:uncharacterized protein (TIGR00297 family)